METRSSWRDDTVALGGSRSEGVVAEGKDAEEASEGATIPEDGRSWGSETVALGEAEGGRPSGYSKAGRREPTGRRALLGAAAGTALILLALAVTSLSGNGVDPTPQPRAAGAVRKVADRRHPASALEIKDNRHRRLERRVRSEKAAREHRRMRSRQEGHRQIVGERSASTAEASPPPEAEADYVPEQSSEPIPQAAPAPEAPRSAGSPTPPGVEFGM